MEVIQIKDLSYWYPDALKPALDQVNLDINEGEFILVVGPSGCGKSTLLRLVNGVVPNFYGGKIKGSVHFKGTNIRYLDKKDIIKNVGFVYQHPEKQIVFQDVEREIAFGLENINMNVEDMKRNVSEVMSFLNLSEIRKKTTQEISGGQKQKIAIASVIAMDPEILVFDEPTSQLDPIASEDVLNSIKKLNRDFGKTVILVEHRLDRCFDMADRIIFMENGKIIGQTRNGEIPDYIDKKYFLPTIPYVFKEAGFSSIPISVKQARERIRGMSFYEPKYVECKDNDIALDVKRLDFEYKKGSKVLKDINFSIKKGEVTAVMGENGAGKSTLFKVITGLIDNYKGQIRINDIDIKNIDMKERIKKIGYLSQNPNDYLGRNSVFEEVSYTLKNIGQFEVTKIESVLNEMDLKDIINKNPRDLSGGEKQRVAIASTLVTDPDIIVLDEPTRGMDLESKDRLGEIILKLKVRGKAVIIITHDSDFAADYSDKVMLMFNGEVATFGYTWDVLYDSIYYSPQIAKVFKNKCKVVKTLDAIKLLRMV